MDAVEFLRQNPGPETRPGHNATNLRSLPRAALHAAFSAIVLPSASHSCEVWQMGFISFDNYNFLLLKFALKHRRS